MVKWGVIGPGLIARVFCNAMRFSNTGRITAIAGRKKEKAEKIAETFAIPKSYEGYESLLADDEIDAVFIATIHPAHAEWAIKAAEAGKHILVEKPIGMSHLEAGAMIDAAEANEIFLMEAFMYRCHPQTQKLVELVRDGAIGEVRMIRAVFSYNAGNTEESLHSRAFANELGGGGILDIGCYTASMARLVAGAASGQTFAEPLDVRGSATIGPTGVDHYAAATLQFENGIIAEIICGVGCRVPDQVTVYGSEGLIDLPNPWLPSTPCRFAKEPLPPDTIFPPSRISLLRHGDAEPESVIVEVDRDLFTYEADNVAENLEHLQSPAMSWRDTLGNMKLLDRWREEANLIYNQERRFHVNTIANRPLVRRDNAQMKYGTIQGLEKPISRLVQGADRNITIPYTEIMFDQFFELGGNCFDTSHAYRAGVCEKNLGDWVQSRSVRDEVVIIEKGGNPPNGTPEGITQELEEGLDGLGLDSVDIWLMHRDNPEVPAGEIVDVLNEHKRSGRMTVFGASNWSLPRLREAKAYAETNGLDYFSVVSNQFSLARILYAWWTDGTDQYSHWQSASDREFRRWFEETQTVLVPWSSQASGFFIEDEAAQPPDRDIARCYHSDENVLRRKRAVELAQKYDVTPINIALAWDLCQAFPVFPIIGARLPGEIRSCIRALDVELTTEEVRWLDLDDSRGEDP